MSRYIPTAISAGVTFDVELECPSYSAPAWSAALYLRGASAITLAALDNAASSHRFYAGATETGGWKPGVYTYAVRISNDEQVVEIETGTVQILSDIASLPVDHDARSQNRKILDAITAVLERRATQDQEKYRINNRELWRTPIPELLTLKKHYAALVAAEEARNRGRSQWGPAVKVRL